MTFNCAEQFPNKANKLIACLMGRANKLPIIMLQTVDLTGRP